MLTRPPRRINLTLRGPAAIAVLIALLALPYVLGRSLEPAEAEALVRQHLAWEATAELRGTSVVDLATAQRLERELERVKGLRFRSVEVRRALVVPPLRRRANFVVKVVMADGRAPTRTRYFWLVGTGRSSVANSSARSWSVPL